MKKRDVNLAVKRAKSRVREESSSSTSRGKISKFSRQQHFSHLTKITENEGISILHQLPKTM